MTGSRETIAERVKTLAYEGGKDNVAALERAWDLAAQIPQGVIFWIHAPQPVLLREVQNLQMQWTRRPQGPRLYDLQVGNGPNRVIDKLNGIKAIDSAIVSGDPVRDLDLLIGAWHDGATRPQPVREKALRLSSSTRRDVRKTSGHLARLWALDEVKRLLAAGNKHTDEAIKLAADYQLVTPVTGAVVLETKEQYDRAGLKPVDAGTVPTIPEPEFYLLAAAAMIVLGWAMFRRRAVCNSI